MSRLVATCPNCKSEVPVRPKMAGQKDTCPVCIRSFVVIAHLPYEMPNLWEKPLSLNDDFRPERERRFSYALVILAFLILGALVTGGVVLRNHIEAKEQRTQETAAAVRRAGVEQARELERVRLAKIEKEEKDKQDVAAAERRYLAESLSRKFHGAFLG